MTLPLFRKLNYLGFQLQGHTYLTSQVLFQGYVDRRFTHVSNRRQYFSSSPRKNVRKSGTNYYDTLEVPAKATQKQIKDSYYSLSKKYHPDVNSSPEAMAKFQEISQAYEVLGSPATRRMYDRGVFKPEYATRRREYAEQSDTQFHQEKVFKKRHSAPTGKTQHYNYDEYYKMHYSEYRQRRASDRAVKAYKEKLKWLAEENKGANSIVEFFIIITLITALCYVSIN